MKISSVVYLSAHGQDVTAATALVQSALELHGVTVVHERQSVRTSSDCRKVYRPLLNGCDTVVQIVGLDAGPALPVDDSDEGPWSLGIWENAEARRLRKPVNRILLADDFPFVFAPRPKTPATARLARKQDAYRRKLSGKGVGLEPVHNHEELIRQVLDLLTLPVEGEGERKPEEVQAAGATATVVPPTRTPFVAEAATLSAEPPEKAQAKTPAQDLVPVSRSCDTERAVRPRAESAPAAEADSAVETIPAASLLVPLVDLPVPLRSTPVVVPRVVSNGRFKVRMKSELTRREPKLPQARILVHESDNPLVPVPKQMGQSVSAGDLILPGELGAATPGRLERLRMTMVGQKDDIPDFSFGVRQTLMLVGASVTVSVLLLGHAVWQHFSPAAPEADVALQEMREVSGDAVTDPVYEPQGTWPDKMPASATVDERIDLPLPTPVILTQSTQAPASLPKAKPSLTLEQEQEILETELGTAIMDRRSSPLSPTAYLQAHAKDLRHLHRRFQRLKGQVVANFLSSNPHVFKLARDIASTHQLCLEYQAAENVLLDSREAAVAIFGGKHAEIRLLDHLIAGNAALKGKTASNPSRSDIPQTDPAKGRHTFPMTPQDMEHMRTELTKHPDLMPASSDLAASGQP